MKRRVLLIAPALMLILACSVTSYGWLEAGHMAVAYVAYQKLTPQTRARVDALVRLNPMYNDWLSRLPADTQPDQKNVRLFMLASIWADDIKKANSGYHDDGKLRPNGTVNANIPPDDGSGGQNLGYSDRLRRRYWHFVDLPFSTDNTRTQPPPEPNAETQIAVFRTVLASNSPDDLKSFDLVWLLHIVGDVHQPLHCTARFTQSTPNGDDGGNGVKVGSDSLHFFWDALPGNTADFKDVIEYAESLSPAPANEANNLTVHDWITQSFELARSTVYKNPPIGNGTGPFTVTNGYRNAASALAKKQVALAGERMANILKNQLR